MSEWKCEGCDWEGAYTELSKDCNGNEICPECPYANGEVYHTNDLEDEE